MRICYLKKETLCYHCGDVIALGTPCVLTTYRDENFFFRYRRHPECYIESVKETIYNWIEHHTYEPEPVVRRERGRPVKYQDRELYEKRRRLEANRRGHHKRGNTDRVEGITRELIRLKSEMGDSLSQDEVETLYGLT